MAPKKKAAKKKKAKGEKKEKVEGEEGKDEIPEHKIPLPTYGWMKLTVSILRRDCLLFGF